METKLQIIRTQDADLENNGCGRHTIGFSSADTFSIDVWFGNNFILKTPEEALVLARKIAAMDDMLHALQSCLPSLRNSSYAGDKVDLVEQAINKALNG